MKSKDLQESYKLLEEVKYNVEHFEELNKTNLDNIIDTTLFEDLINRNNKLKMSIEKYKPTDKTIVLQSARFFIRHSTIILKLIERNMELK